LGGGLTTSQFINQLPGLPGSYALMAILKNPIGLESGLYKGKSVPSGRYLYAGSAFGPGGLKARIARHLDPQRKVFWHVDYLKPFWHIDEIWILGGGVSRECALIDAFSQIPGIEFPLAGFGASDCRNNCQAHLVHLPEELSLQAIFNHIQSYFSCIQRLSVS
jgi:Uri superfamily endonuclease